MELSYTYEKGEKFLVGHLDEYPEYPTQGVDLKDLEDHLQDIYSMIQDGTLEPKRHGILRIIVPRRHRRTVFSLLPVIFLFII
jgi:hypothetical protein